MIDLPDPLRPPSNTNSWVAKPPFIASNSLESPEGYILKSSSLGKNSSSATSYSSSSCGMAWFRCNKWFWNLSTISSFSKSVGCIPAFNLACSTTVGLNPSVSFVPSLSTKNSSNFCAAVLFGLSKD